MGQRKYRVNFDGIEMLGLVDLMYWTSIESVRIAHQIISDINMLNRDDINVVDLGCGCGCIGLLVSNGTALKNRVVMVDNDPNCIEYSLQNAGRAGIEIRTFEGDFWDVFEHQEEKFDIVSACIPCYNEEEWEARKEKYENTLSYMYLPKAAYCAGEDRNACFRKVIVDGKKYINDGGYIYFEVPREEQRQEVKTILTENGYGDFFEFGDGFYLRATYNPSK